MVSAPILLEDLEFLIKNDFEVWKSSSAISLDDVIKSLVFLNLLSFCYELNFVMLLYAVCCARNLLGAS